jgi:hypothetical protein
VQFFETNFLVAFKADNACNFFGAPPPVRKLK